MATLGIPQNTIAILQKYNFMFQKRFGQNFLQDQHVMQNIVRSINPQFDDNIVEIGPGLAALTEPVSEKVNKLHVIELDKDLAKRLREHPFLSPKLDIHEADALKFDFNELVHEDKPLRVFGNLPYNISTPLMIHLFSYSDKIKDMHFMLQKEVVERLCAAPNSKNYGRLSVIAQYYCKTMPIMEVPPTAFRPAPKVVSAVIRLIPHKEKPFVANNIENLEKVLAVAFNKRRKTIHNSLSSLFSDEDLQKVGLDFNLRAENINLEQYVQLANLLP